MSLIKVILYSLPSGKKPFAEWLNKFNAQERAIFIKRIDRVSLQNFGDCKPIKTIAGLWELRINHGPGYRIYFGKQGPSIILLLIGGSKQTQKRDTEKAKKYWIEYRELIND